MSRVVAAPAEDIAIEHRLVIASGLEVRPQTKADSPPPPSDAASSRPASATTPASKFRLGFGRQSSATTMADDAAARQSSSLFSRLRRGSVPSAAAPTVDRAADPPSAPTPRRSTVSSPSAARSPPASPPPTRPGLAGTRASGSWTVISGPSSSAATSPRPSLFSGRSSSNRTRSTTASSVPGSTRELTASEMSARIRTLPRLLSYSAQNPPPQGGSPVAIRRPSSRTLPAGARYQPSSPGPAPTSAAPPAWSPSAELFPATVEPPLVDSEVDTPEQEPDTEDDGSGSEHESPGVRDEFADARSSPRDSPTAPSTPFAIAPLSPPAPRTLALAGVVASNNPVALGWTAFDGGTPTPAAALVTPGSSHRAGGSSYFDIPRRASAERTGAITPRPIVNTRPSMTRGRTRSLIELRTPDASPSRGTPVHPSAMSLVDSSAVEVLAAPEPIASPSPSAKRVRPTDTIGRSRSQSMIELREPPSYVPPPPGFVPLRTSVVPRGEEGRERLPPYSCAVHIEGEMPRKMEFVAPGVQAPNRTWRTQYIVIHGTSIRIYKSDPHLYPVAHDDSGASRRDSTGLRKSISSSRLGRLASASRSSLGLDARSRSASTANLSDMPQADHSPDEMESDHDGAALSAHVHARDEAAALAAAKRRRLRGSGNALVHHYTLQGAESGLAADYLKRKHVVRVRAEGEQFLLQTNGDAQVVAWIEALQAATNIALDLDVRPLPKLITLPRRRRRRRNPDGTPITTSAAAGASAGEPTGETIDAPQSRAFERMLVEEAALDTGPQATVM